MTDEEYSKKQATKKEDAKEEEIKKRPEWDLKDVMNKDGGESQFKKIDFTILQKNKRV